MYIIYTNYIYVYINTVRVCEREIECVSGYAAVVAVQTLRARALSFRGVCVYKNVYINTYMQKKKNTYIHSAHAVLSHCYEFICIRAHIHIQKHTYRGSMPENNVYNYKYPRICIYVHTHTHTYLHCKLSSLT